MLALCWHNVPAYYALNYAGIFDGGLHTDFEIGTITQIGLDVFCVDKTVD